MPKCGNCKQDGMTVEHVKECFAGRYATLTDEPKVTGFAQGYVESQDFVPLAFMNSLPASKYAVETPEGLKFYEVQVGKPGTKWDGFRFVSHLVGHPGDWAKYPVKGAARKELLAELSVDAKAAAVLFSKNFTVCAVCGSPLSDPESLALGLGPVCATRF